MKSIYIGSDHAGIEAKQEVKNVLRNNSIPFEDVGVFSKQSIDYPDIAKEVCSKILKEDTLGILICGSGTGMQIASNKVPRIRAAFCYDAYGSEMARKDNDANILTLRARNFNWDYYESIVLSFLFTSFSKEERHQRRIDKLE